MKVYIASACLLLLQLAYADELININGDLDEALIVANKILTSKGKGLIKLRPLIYNNIQMLNGVLVGANSLMRIGDATLRTYVENKLFHADLHVAQRLHELAFGKIILNGDEMSGTFNVKNMSFHANFTLLHYNYNDTDCGFRLNRYEYEGLASATFQASLPQYSGDVSEMFTNTILPKINERVSSVKDRVEQAAQALICKNQTKDAQQFLLNVLAVLFNI